MTKLRTAATAVARRRLAIAIYGLLALAAGLINYALYQIGEIFGHGGGLVAGAIGVSVIVSLVAWDLSRE